MGWACIQARQLVTVSEVSNAYLLQVFGQAQRTMLMAGCELELRLREPRLFAHMAAKIQKHRAF